MCCTIFCVPTSALLLNDEVTSIEYLDNGDRIETVISYKAPDKSSVTVNSSTKAATKTNFSTQKINVRHPIKFCVNNNHSSNNKTADCGVIKRVFYPQILSITGSKLCPSFDIFVSSVRQFFATLNTTFCAGCHHS